MTTGSLLRHPLLSEGETRELIRSAQAGDRRSRDRVILHNQRLVRVIARRFLFSRHALDDLVGWGNIGLIRAVDEIDLVFYPRFDFYATRAITNAIRYHIFDYPHYLRAAVKRYDILARTTGLGHDAILAAIDVKASWKAGLDHVIRNRRMQRVGLVTIDIACEPDMSVEHRDEWENVEGLMRTLPARHYEYLELHHVNGLSFPEIGEEKGVSRQYVRKVVNQAVERLTMMADGGN